MTEEPPRRQALAYIEKLEEETMRLAWKGVPETDRPRLVAAAIIFGRRFESRVPEGSEPSQENELQRLLMRLMSDVIEELSDIEGTSKDEATEFLGDVGMRDKVLEMDEVVSAYENGGSGESLDSLLREAVEGRREKAVWADHWKSLRSGYWLLVFSFCQ